MNNSSDQLQNVIKYTYYEIGQVKWDEQGDKCGVYERDKGYSRKT